MHRPSFSIKSSSSERELSFADPTRDGYTVTYRGNDVHACCGVYEFMQGDNLATLFQRVASFRRPWPGVEEWRSLEGEFSLAATCSSLGVVTFTASLSGLPGAPEEWRLTASLTSELGQLQRLAEEACLFFSAGSD